MNLGISINLFNGEELLESSLKHIRDYSDNIVIIYQNVSNFGSHKKNLTPLIKKLKSKKLLDHYILYEPKKDFIGLDKNIKELIINEANIFNGQAYDQSIYYGIFNEMNKRNISLNFLRECGCTHVLDMDCDEFYLDHQLIYGIEEMIRGGYDGSFCQMQTYYKYFDCKISPPETYYVPFIYKIKPTSKFEQIENADFPVYCDGKRRIKTGYPYVFSREELEMHHFSYVRKNKESMKSKFLNCSSRMNFNEAKINKLIDHWEIYEKGNLALFNANGMGVKLCEIEKIDEPLFNIKFN